MSYQSVKKAPTVRDKLNLETLRTIRPRDFHHKESIL